MEGLVQIITCPCCVLLDADGYEYYSRFDAFKLGVEEEEWA